VTEGERALAAGRLLAVTEVARLLGVCSATVYALCAKGDLPHVRVLNAIRVAPGDLEAFVEGRVAKRR
jgi:excisionase family DNA binding protein